MDVEELAEPLLLMWVLLWTLFYHCTGCRLCVPALTAGLRAAAPLGSPACAMQHAVGGCGCGRTSEVNALCLPRPRVPDSTQRVLWHRMPSLLLLAMKLLTRAFASFGCEFPHAGTSRCTTRATRAWPTRACWTSSARCVTHVFDRGLT